MPRQDNERAIKSARQDNERAIKSARFAFTRRDLRLGSGVVLFIYVTSHLVNHALGLVSLEVAEAGLRIAVGFWHSLPGTLLLYGAAAAHLALAFLAVYERRTLRIPPAEVLRVALGFGIPMLLIGHAVATRLAFEVYGHAVEYTRIVHNLWSSDNEGRQLALLAPGWLHGCLGLYFAFGHRPLWQRGRYVLFGLAVLLPVLSGLGFVAMAREIAPDEVATLHWSEDNQGTNLQHGFTVARQILSRYPGSNKQMIVVTDGEPTAHVMEDGEPFFMYPAHPETERLTLREALRCSRDGVRINTFMIESNYALQSFVEEMTALVKGRAFSTDPNRLGQYVLLDYVNQRRKRVA